MKTEQIVVAVVVVALVGGIVGGYFYPKSGFVGAFNAAGTTFNSAKTAMKVWNPTSASATSTSLYNSDATDRIVKQVQFYCKGLTNSFAQTAAGVASLQFTMATSSTDAPAIITNTNTLLTSAVVATSSPELYVSTTSPGVTGTAGKDFARVWASGTYLSVTANATSSAQSCVIGVDYAAT